jgi:hypothetical protein
MDVGPAWIRPGSYVHFTVFCGILGIGGGAGRLVPWWAGPCVLNSWGVVEVGAIMAQLWHDYGTILRNRATGIPNALNMVVCCLRAAYG